MFLEKLIRLIYSVNMKKLGERFFQAREEKIGTVDISNDDSRHAKNYAYRSSNKNMENVELMHLNLSLKYQEIILQNV